MRRRSLIATALLAPAIARAAAPLRVVASFSVLGDMAAEIGGDRAAVASLVGPDQDVHTFEPRPRDLRTLAGAGLLVVNGLGLEGWLDRLTQATGFTGSVAVATAAVAPRTMKENGGPIATDPHAWQDPANAVLYVAAIEAGLAAADPGNAAAYADAASGYAARIADTGAWIEATLAPVPAERRRIITTHDAFGYYGDRYGIEFLAAEGASTDSEPSAKSIAALVAQIKREKVRAVFIENMTNDRIARMLADETGAVLGGTVYSDALSAANGPAPTYLAMLRHNTSLFAAAMKAA